MSTRSILLGSLAVVLFFALLVLNWPKKQQKSHPQPVTAVVAPVETSVAIEEAPVIEQKRPIPSLSSDEELPGDVNRMAELFCPYPPNLPFVETVSYKPRVGWLEGRPAYLGDYASHFQTSKHFISRSLRGAANYFSETLSSGDRFNVFKEGYPVEFHLVIDLSRLKMWCYYYDQAKNVRGLLRSYPVCAGRLDSTRPSKSLTPFGVFRLGDQVAVHHEGMKGEFRGVEREIIGVFGKRWMPLGEPLANCTGPSKGLGIHGVPWRRDSEGTLYEVRDCIGDYQSGGCIRLYTEDVEELFSIVVTKPTYIHIVPDFQSAILPGQLEI